MQIKRLYLFAWDTETKVVPQIEQSSGIILKEER